MITETGCVNLDGDMALAFVRSRRYEYEDPIGSGNWIQDGTSDFGRISRQQDFVRRTISKAVNEGLYSPDIAAALIETNREYLVTDAALTPRRMLEFANTLRTLDPAQVTTYRIESTTEVTAAGDDVQRPLIRNDNMQAILSVFRGEATIASAPEQTVGTTTTTVPTPPTTRPTDDTVPSDGSVPATVDTTLPVVEVTENLLGVSTAARRRLRLTDPSHPRPRTRSRAATMPVGPDAVVHRAPTCPASSAASAASPSGAMMTSSSSACAAAWTSPGSVARQSDSRTVTRRCAAEASSCSRAAARARATSVVPWPRSANTRSITSSGSWCSHIAVQAMTSRPNERTAHSGRARCTTAAAAIAAVATGSTVHRTRAIHEQAPCGRRRRPRRHPQRLDVDGLTTGASIEQGLEAGIEIEIALRSIRSAGDLADAAIVRTMLTGEVEEQLSGETLGELAQCPIGGPRHARQGCQRRVRVLVELGVECGLVDLADLG